MAWWWPIAGSLVLLTTSVDVIWTTLTLNGAGPISRRISEPIGNALLRLSHRRHLDWLSLNAGVAAILATLVSWILLVWLGWTLVFLGSEGAVVRAKDGSPAGLIERMYFVGFTVITLGTGDYRPAGGPWQLATVVASINGFVLVTLSITYLLPVLSAVIQKRTLAITLYHLGHTPEEVVRRAWDQQGFRVLEQQLVSLVPLLVQDGQRRLSYPVLNFFRAPRPDTSFALSLIVLDDALTLLEHGVAPERRPPTLAIAPLREAISDCSLLLHSRGHLEPVDATPPPHPSLDQLREVGIPTVCEDAFREQIERLGRRRRRLAALVEAEGWHWDDVLRRERRGATLRI